MTKKKNSNNNTTTNTNTNMPTSIIFWSALGSERGLLGSMADGETVDGKYSWGGMYGSPAAVSGCEPGIGSHFIKWNKAIIQSILMLM